MMMMMMMMMMSMDELSPTVEWYKNISLVHDIIDCNPIKRPGRQ